MRTSRICFGNLHHITSIMLGKLYAIEYKTDLYALEYRQK